MHNKLVSAVVAVCVAGCATPRQEIQASYVSPLQYQSHNCTQVGEELDRVTRRISEVGGNIDKRSSNDEGAMAIGMSIFWPALFFLKGDGPEAKEYARLKGEYDTLEKVAIQKEYNRAAMPRLVEPPKDAPARHEENPAKPRVG